MYVAVCKLTLHIPASRSRKDRRRVVVSLCERIRHKFGVSVAEVGGQDTWQMAEVGIVAVSGASTTASQLLDRAVEYAESNLFEAVVTDRQEDLFDY